jgi:hypothetical protein
LAERLDGLAAALERYRAQGCVLEPEAVAVLLGVLRGCAADAAAGARAAPMVSVPVLGRVS